VRNVIISFGLLITLLIVLFKLAEVQFTQGNVRMEVIIAVTSVIFFVIGVYINQKKVKESNTAAGNTESPVLRIDSSFGVNHDPLKDGLSKREMDVLVKMGDGLSNLEIAGALFLSESTIKTHVSNILFKLDAKRRTEAVKIARERKLIN
jgi:DNA-binding NarL/FixJ family response regulator